jgi:hypothetical protein
MRWAAQAALAGLFVAGVSTNGFSATAQDSAAPAKDSAKAEAAQPSLEGVIGKKLLSIDGSLITLSAAEGVLAREIVAPNGAIQRSNFRFLNERLGTVSDARDNTKVVGVFRSSQADLNIQYADGTVETLLANSAGGISLETKPAAGAVYCTAWYPDGHVFSTEDRKAALAQYANKLGLGDTGDKKPEVPHGCNAAAPAVAAAAAAPAAAADTSVKKVDAAKVDAPKTDTAKVDAPKTDVAKTDAPKTDAVKVDVAKTDAPKTDVGKTDAPKTDAAKVDAPKTDVAKTDAPKTDAAKPAVLAGAVVAAGKAAPKTVDLAATAASHAIDVRTSEVHTIDAPLAAAGGAAAGAAAAGAAAAKTEEKTETPAPQKLAALEKPAAETPKGASSCLSVESDGSHWGFKNRCGFTVQFAYCLMGASTLASCKDGAVVGSVAGNGFGALVSDDSLKETDVAHDFRWVACQGGAGEVIPHLDETSPPSGRCVR